jgi:hypothetical protein
MGEKDENALKEVIYNRSNTNGVDYDIASLQPRKRRWRTVRVLARVVVESRVLRSASCGYREFPVRGGCYASRKLELAF